MKAPVQCWCYHHGTHAHIAMDLHSKASAVLVVQRLLQQSEVVQTCRRHRKYSNPYKAALDDVYLPMLSIKCMLLLAKNTLAQQALAEASPDYSRC